MKKKVLAWILFFGMVMTLFPSGALATDEPATESSGSSPVTLVSPVDDLSALHWTYKDGDIEPAGISDMLSLFAEHNSLTACDQNNNKYTVSITWAYYGYKDPDGTMHAQDAKDFLLKKGTTYYFMPVLNKTEEGQYSFGDITHFLVQVDYFLNDPGAGTQPSASSSALPQPSASSSASPQPSGSPTATPQPSGNLIALNPAIAASQTSAVSVTNNTYTDACPHNVNLSNTAYSLTLDLDPTGFAGTPKLVASIPKGVTLSSYPTASNPTLANYIKDVNTQTETDGSTTLTYTFNTGISTVGFNINLLPTYKLKTGQTCTVTVNAYDGDTQKGTAADSIAIKSNPTLANGAYNAYDDTNCWFVDAASTDYYYVKASEYFMPNYSYTNHYDYDSLTLTVPIPDNATPGYYQGDTFVPLSPGGSFDFTNGKATYKTDCTFTTDSGSTYGTAGQGHAVVYELTASHGLTSSNNYTAYYMYNSNMGGVYLRFPGDTAAGVYTAGISPKVVAKADEDNYTLMEYSQNPGGQNYWTVNYTFRNYNINDYIYTGMGTGYTSYYSWQYLMPDPDNQYFLSYLYNSTENALTNAKVEYTGGYSGSTPEPLSADIHCYKLVFNLASSGTNPSTADVTYSYYDASAGEVKTGGHAYLTASDNAIALDTGDYFTYIAATYDRLGANSSLNTIQNAYCYNANGANSGTCYVYSKILSATVGSKTYDPSAWTNTSNTYFYPRTSLPVTPNSINLQGTANGMDKGSQYSFSFYPASFGTLKNMCVYFMLPKGYEFQSYAPPYDWGVTGSDYTISSRSISVGSDTDLTAGGVSYPVAAGTYTLYTVRYTDGASHPSNSQHTVYFSLGPTVDTAEVKTGIYVPAAIGLTTESTIFPFDSNTYYQMKDLLDFDNDGNTTETFATFYNRTASTQNAAKVISLSGSLTSSYESGSGSSKSYQYNSTGAYTFTVYNGLDSGNTAQNATINIKVPSAGTDLAAKIIGAPTLSGNFLSGASVTYSTDGGLTYQSSAGDWGTVTDIKIATASGIALSSGDSAFVTLPFTASYGASVTPSSTALFNATMSYSLYKNGSLTSTPSTTAQDCMMRTAYVPVSGTVFKDYDNDGVRDTNEQNNGKSYSVNLYAGAYTNGTADLTYIAGFTTNTSGTYSFANNIYLPGTYTLCVNLESTETLNGYSAGWTRDGGYAYYTFTVGGSVTGMNVNLPLSAPRTLILNYSSCYLYDNATKKLISTVFPTLLGTESVTYTSSDPGVATVSTDGMLTYVSDGTTTVTATAPGCGEGSGNVTAACTVYARKGSYQVALHAGDNTTLDSSCYTLSSGVYTGSYAPGSYVSLPASDALTNSDPSYYFEGWYDNPGFTGWPVSYIPDTGYGNKEYYAKWTRNEAAYETSPGVWAYGSFWTAMYSVYDGGTVKLLKDVTFDGAPTIDKHFTLKTDGSARTLNLGYYMYVTSGSLTVDDANLTVNAGSLGGVAIYMNGTGSVNIKAGTVSTTGSYGVYDIAGTVYDSGGTVTSTNSNGYGIYNAGSGNVYLSGVSTVSGSSGDIYESTKSTVFGSDGTATPTHYSGGNMKVCCGWPSPAAGDVVVNGVSGSGQFTALNTGDYTAKITSGNLVITKYDYSGTQASAPTMQSRSDSSITLDPQTISGQTVEYVCSTTDAVPASGWQTSTVFTGLDSGTTYYFFARVMETPYTQPGVAADAAFATKTALLATVSMAGYTYDGTVASPSVSSNPGGGTVNYYYNDTDTNSGGTEWNGITPATLDSGTYYMYAVIAETDDYTGCTTAATAFTVGRYSGNVTVHMADYTYGGTVSAPSADNPGGSTVTYYYNTTNQNSGGTEWTGITPTTLNAGKYYMYAIIGETLNYSGCTTEAAEFTVKPMGLSVVWTGDTASYVYNGTSQGGGITARYVEKDGHNVALNIQFTLSGITADFRDAGTYTATASMALADGNYTLTNQEKTIKMAPAAVTVTVNDKAVPYGDAAADPGYTVSGGLFGTDAIAGTPRYDFGGYTTGGNTGSYAITVSGLSNPNYSITIKPGTLTVQPASIINKTPTGQTATYTGQQLGIRTAPLGTTVNNQPLTVKYSADGGKTYGLDTAPAFTNVGEYTVYYELSAPNHTPVTGTIAFSVTRNTTNSINGLSCGSFTYGGTPSPSIGSANFGGSAVTYTYSGSMDGAYGPWKDTNNAGVWWVKAAIPDTANYAGTEAYARFMVIKAVASTPELKDKSYTGNSLTADVPASKFYSVKSNNGGIEVGTYQVTLTLTDPQNYRWSSTDSPDLTLPFRITKAGANAITGISCPDVSDGGAPAPAITGAAYGANTVIYTYSSSRDGTYGPWRADNTPGTYWVKATIPATDSYTEAVFTARFTYGQERKQGSLGVSISNGTSGSFDCKVSVQSGNDQVAFKTLSIAMGATGTVKFDDLPAAFYNVVVSTGDYTDTKMLEVNGETQSTASFDILDLNHRTVVEIKDNTPDVAVDNLSSVFENPATEDNMGITQKDLDCGKPIEIQLKAETVRAVNEQEKNELQKLCGSNIIGLYIDLSLYKLVGEDETRLIGVNNLLEVAIPIPDEMKGRESTIAVYRIHEGQPQAITKNPNSDGEYLEIRGDYVILHVKNFSTYALGYSLAGSAADGFPWWWLLLLLIPIIIIIYYRRKRKKQKNALNV